MQVYKTKAKKFSGTDFHEVHRFYGTSAENELFCVQIKENMKNKQKYLISVFPTEGPNIWDA